MKNKRTVIALLLFTALCAAIFAQTGDDFKITQNSKGTITITGYTGKATKVIIPSTIEGIKVTEIEENAFHGNKNITSVTIPNSITNIKKEIFSDCTSLTSVTIPNSVTEIEEGAFNSCISLISITIPNSVTSIGENAFWGCTILSSITIGAKKNYENEFSNNFSSYYESQEKKAGTYMWTGRLWKIPTADELAEFAELLVQARKVCSNFRVTRDGKEVVINKYVGKETVVEIPSSILKTPITQIGYKAFKNCTNLTRITIPNSVTSIGDSAFSDCTSLTSIIIPNSVSDIYGAFEGCTKLTSITIGANKYITYAKFPNNFDAYYESQGKKAGTYTWSGRLWSVK